MPRWRTTAGTIVLVALVAVASVLVYRGLLDVGRPPSPPATAPEPAAAPRRVVRLGVASRYAPNLIYARYQPLVDHLNAHGRHAYELRPSLDYRDAVAQLQRGEVVASFLGAWILRTLGPESGLEPLLRALDAQGQPSVRDVLIVREGSPVRSLADLAGLRVAVPSRDSWAGNWLQAEGLSAVALTAADLDTIRHFDHHETVVWRVLRGEYAAGVVKQSVAARHLAEGLRVVATSGPIPGPPLVVRAGDDDPAVAEIRALLLALDPADESARRALAAGAAEFAGGFAPASWRDYQAPDERPGEP